MVRPAWLRGAPQRVWVPLWIALVASILIVAWAELRLPPPSPSMRCENGDASACRGLPRDDADRDAL